jgi:hypothetical protein
MGIPSLRPKRRILPNDVQALSYQVVVRRDPRGFEPDLIPLHQLAKDGALVEVVAKAVHSRNENGTH